MTSSKYKRSMREILARTPVMPILTIHDAAIAGDLARALVEGGIPVFEVVLRTPATLDAVRAMIEAAPEADVGIGTLLTPEDVQLAVDAGVDLWAGARRGELRSTTAPPSRKSPRPVARADVP